MSRGVRDSMHASLLRLTFLPVSMEVLKTVNIYERETFIFDRLYCTFNSEITLCM